MTGSLPGGIVTGAALSFSALPRFVLVCITARGWGIRHLIFCSADVSVPAIEGRLGRPPLQLEPRFPRHFFAQHTRKYDDRIDCTFCAFDRPVSDGAVA